MGHQLNCWIVYVALQFLEAFQAHLNEMKLFIDILYKQIIPIFINCNYMK